VVGESPFEAYDAAEASLIGRIESPRDHDGHMRNRLVDERHRRGPRRRHQRRCVGSCAGRRRSGAPPERPVRAESRGILCRLPSTARQESGELRPHGR